MDGCYSNKLGVLVAWWLRILQTTRENLNAKYLGVLVDDELDWSPNTDALYRKEQSMFWTMRS